MSRELSCDGMSHVTYEMSHVTYEMSHVTYERRRVTYEMSHVTRKILMSRELSESGP